MGQPPGVALARTASLVLAAIVVAVAVSIPAAHAHRASSSKTIVRTWYVRWPASANRSRYRVLTLKEPFGFVRSGHVYVNGFRVDSSFLRPSDWIVACAHRGPAFASATLHRANGTIYALVVLTTGECASGPSVAGKLARVKVVITYTPW